MPICKRCHTYHSFATLLCPVCKHKRPLWYLLLTAILVIAIGTAFLLPMGRSGVERDVKKPMKTKRGH